MAVFQCFCLETQLAGAAYPYYRNIKAFKEFEVRFFDDILSYRSKDIGVFSSKS